MLRHATYQDGLETKRYGKAYPRVHHIVSTAHAAQWTDGGGFIEDTSPQQFAPWLDEQIATGHIDADTSRPMPPAESDIVTGNFRKHKLDCDNCGGPLRVLAGKLASCEHCQSQYYLEGYDPHDLPEMPWDQKPAQPYYLGGGVSARTQLKPYVDNEWEDYDPPPRPDPNVTDVMR
jgi:hypothetical protein